MNRLRGGEPIERPGDLYIQADLIVLKQIEIHLHHALPHQIRQIEKRYFHHL